MTNEKYAQLLQEWAYVQKLETEMMESAFRKVMDEVLGAIFGSESN